MWQWHPLGYDSVVKTSKLAGYFEMDIQIWFAKLSIPIIIGHGKKTGEKNQAAVEGAEDLESQWSIET